MCNERLRGVCLAPRIDDQYNDPSPSYGGYRLPKGKGQLLDSRRGMPYTSSMF